MPLAGRAHRANVAPVGVKERAVLIRGLLVTELDRFSKLFDAAGAAGGRIGSAPESRGG